MQNIANMAMGWLITISLLLVAANMAFSMLGWKRAQKQVNRAVSRGTESVVVWTFQTAGRLVRWGVRSGYHAIRSLF